MGWYDSNWTYRKKITIDHTKVAGDETDFPVLISLASDADLAAEAQADGDDILFTSSDGTTKLKHELERFTSGTGELVAWVKVPSLSSSTDTELYMYYGNATCGAQEDPTNVWDSDYEGVWHLEEEQAGTGNLDLYQDSTVNNRDGDDDVSETGQTGKIANGQDFDGTNDGIKMDGYKGVLGQTPRTCSAWIKTATGKDQGIMGWGSNNPPEDGKKWVLRMDEVDTGKWGLMVEVKGGSRTGTTELDDDNWYYVACTWTGTDINTAKLYVNGSEETYQTTDPQTVNTVDENSFRLGYTPFEGRYWDGSLDECRLSSAVRSANWISTEYQNQNAPSSFYTLGSEETEGAQTYTKTYTADTLLKALGLTKTYTSDVLLKAVNLTKTYTADLLLQALGLTKTYDGELLLKALDLTKTYLADLLLKVEDLTKNYTADVILSALAVYTKTYDVDVLLKALGVTKTYEADVLLQVTDQLKTYTADLILTLVATKTYTADLLLKGIGITKTYTADVIIGSAGLSYTQGATLFTRGSDLYSQNNPIYTRN